MRCWLDCWLDCWLERIGGAPGELPSSLSGHVLASGVSRDAHGAHATYDPTSRPRLARLRILAGGPDLTANQQEWLEALAAFKDQRQPCAHVVVIGVRGSAPREIGARMIVSDGRLAWGTIGGGRLEHLAIERATELCVAGEPRSVTETVPLSEKAGQCCGGEVTLLIEAFPWNRQKLVIFGAGHVAQAVAGLGPYMDLDVQLIDGRSAEEIEPRIPEDPGYDVLFIDAPEEEVDVIPGDALLLVMTHDHSLDQEIIARAMKRGSFPYVGLIGSDRKWIRFKHRLEQRGFGPEDLARITCPIGVVKGSKEPRKIALSVATEIAELLAEAAR